MEKDFNTKERKKIITNIVAYVIERNEGDISFTELGDLDEELQETKDEKLYKRWKESVGEWLLSTERVNTEEEVEEQFNKLISKDKKIDYGFTYSC
ncbi:MAG: hypothetical protein ACOCP8_02095 [archaeon]